MLTHKHALYGKRKLGENTIHMQYIYKNNHKMHTSSEK